MRIQNRTDIGVPVRYTRWFETPDGLAGDELARAIKEKIGHGWSYLELAKADLHKADLHKVFLRWSDLTGANLAGAKLTGANLNGTELTDAKLNDAKLTGAKLNEAGLRGANLTNAKLIRASLHWSNLTGAKLTGADLTCAKLKGADLTDTELTGANLNGAELTGAQFLAAAEHERILKIQLGNGCPWEIAAFASYCGTQDLLAVGCQCVLISECEDLPDATVDDMHHEALPFWREHKATLIRLAKEKIGEFRKSEKLSLI